MFTKSTDYQHNSNIRVRKTNSQILPDLQPLVSLVSEEMTEVIIILNNTEQEMAIL